MRVARIVPCLLLFIFIMSLLFLLSVSGFVPKNKGDFNNILYYVIIFQFNNHFLQIDPYAVYPWGPLWSLSIEETFYLIFPIACFLLHRASVLVVVLMCLIVYGPSCRNSTSDLYSWWASADLLTIGCLTAITLRQTKDFRFGLSIFIVMRIVGAAIIALSFWASPWLENNTRFGPTFAGFGAAVFIFGSSTYTNEIFISRAIELPFSFISNIGIISYELYVFHMAWLLIFLNVADKKIGEALPFIYDIFLIISLLIFSFIVNRCYSEPLNKLIRIFYIKN